MNMCEQIFKMCRVGEARRQLIRAHGENRCIVSYKTKDSSVIRLAETCLIFEVLECRYCFIQELRESSLEDIMSALEQMSNIRAAHRLMADTFNIVRRSAEFLLIEMNQVLQTEQVTWMDGVRNGTLKGFAIQNVFVNSSLLSSAI